MIKLYMFLYVLNTFHILYDRRVISDRDVKMGRVQWARLVGLGVESFSFHSHVLFHSFSTQIFLVNTF
jgi:hypothetical protein